MIRKKVRKGGKEEDEKKRGIKRMEKEKKA